jgi:hypothetical protein
MLVLPIESRALLVLAAPVPQFKDKDKKEPATDRETGQVLVEVAVSLVSDTGGPQVLRVSVPQPGVPKDLAMGQLVRATGLTLIAGETHGRAWQMFRAASLAMVKAG